MHALTRKEIDKRDGKRIAIKWAYDKPEANAPLIPTAHFALLH
jgi:hypothetical protein